VRADELAEVQARSLCIPERTGDVAVGTPVRGEPGGSAYEFEHEHAGSGGCDPPPPQAEYLRPDVGREAHGEHDGDEDQGNEPDETVAEFALDVTWTSAGA
jgi:hypothetical protein